MIKRYLQPLALAIVLLAVPSLAQTPAEIGRQLASHLDDVEKYGNYGESNDDEKCEAANDAIFAKLKENGSRLDILKYAFPELKDKIRVATSKDGRFRTYSWDMNTGGTMHDHASVVQYQGKSGKVFSWTEEGDEMGAGSFVTEVFQLDARGGTIYMPVSTFIGSTSLNGQSLRLVKIAGDKLDRDVKLIKTPSGTQNSVGFEYNFFSVVDRPERPVKLFVFDAAKKQFSFPVVIADDDDPIGRVTKKLITYRFNGTYFVKVN